MLENRLVRTASELGCILDCDLTTGKTASGGAATDNTSIINAYLAQATANNPVTLIIDGGSLITGIMLPANGYTSIIGCGWHTGFYMKSGSNNHAIQNGTSQLPQTGNAAPGPPAPAITGGNVRFENFMINGNRGDGTTGNSTTGDPRGYSTYWLLGITLYTLSNIVLRDLYLYDIATYATRFGNVSQVLCDNVVVVAPSMAMNTDGIHFDGPASDVHVSNCSITCGDDAIALNGPEGFSGDINRVTVTNCIVNAYSLVRFYGVSSTVTVHGRNILVSNCFAQCIGYGFPLGFGGGTQPLDLLQDFTVSNVAFICPNITYISDNIGSLKFNNCVWLNNTASGAGWITFTTQASISSVEINGCTSFNGQGTLVGPTNWGNIGVLRINGFSQDVSYGQSMTPLAQLIAMNNGTINRLVINGLDTTHIAALGSGPTINEIIGTGVLQTGWQFSDAEMGNGVLYYSSTQAGALCVKTGGTVHKITTT